MPRTLPGWAGEEDEILVGRLRSGEEHAFEELIRRYGPPLLSVARRLLRSEEDARDAVQDTFVSVVKSIGSFESKSSLSTWLHRIVVNASLVRLRSKRRHPEEDIEAWLPRFEEDGHQVAPGEAWAVSPESALVSAERRATVRASIDRLPETFRTVLVLHDIEELSTRETAEALGLTSNAVKIRLHRGRQALRTLLDPHMR